MIPALPIVDLVDGFMSEYFFQAPPDKNSITEYKIFRGLGKPIAYLPNCGSDMAALFSRNDITQLTKIFTAEAYASGEFTYVPYNALLNNPEGWKLYSADMKELSPYYDFIAENEEYYSNCVSTADTAVLYSYATVRNNQQASYKFFGICNTLLDLHRQYDVLFAGDGDWIDDTLSADKLNQYDAVILPGVKDISDDQLGLLLNYVNRGGKVYAFGETAMCDELGQWKQRAELKNLLAEGVHQYGLGQFVYRKDDVGARYLSNKDVNIRQELAGIFNGLNREDIQTNASEKVAMLSYRNTSLGADIIHLINYDYDSNAQHINKQSNIAMDVLLNSKPLGKDLGVFYASPDWGDIKELKYSISNNKMSFTIPSLDTYGVVYIGEKNK
jgi:hypothetical protein